MTTKTTKSTLDTLYRSPLIRAAVAFAVITLGASALLGGCEPAYVEGDRLSFTGTDIQGQPVSLADARFQGKVVLVELWGTWCPVCMSSMPALNDLHARFSSQGLEVLAVEFAAGYSGSPEEYVAALRAWATENKIAFTVAHAGETGIEETVFPTLKSFDGYPTIILIGRDGVVRHVQSGYHSSDAQMLERKITELLAESAD